MRMRQSTPTPPEWDASGLVSVAHAPDPGVLSARLLAPSTSRPGVFMRISRPSRRVRIARRVGVPPMPPSSPWMLRPVWRTLVGWSTRIPVGYGRAGSSGRQPEPGLGVRERSTAAESCEHNQRRVEAGRCSRILALIATLSNPDREIVLLRVMSGMSIPDIVTALGVTPDAVRQAMSPLQPAVTADGTPPATRQRMVLLPHVRAGPTNSRAGNHRTGGPPA
jgi:sigma-70-like protein